MSVSKKALTDVSLCDSVVRQYRSLTMTVGEVAKLFQISAHTAMAILKLHVSPEELARLRGANHSRSKTGKANPMFGRRHAAERILRNGRAAVWNGKGYTYEHRLTATRMLGLPSLPGHLVVHHIDGDKTNNDPDNLAILTQRGHMKLHKQILGRLYAWEKEKFGTSLLPEMQATLLKD